MFAAPWVFHLKLLHKIHREPGASTAVGRINPLLRQKGQLSSWLFTFFVLF